VPTWSEFVANFGVKELILVLFAIGVIVTTHEGGRFFKKEGR
jgi:hypothetical protein